MVSVVIPAYNCEKTIIQAVESVYADAHSSVEIIIINDGSTDNTKKVINDLKPATKGAPVVFHQSNLGGNAARNKGVDLAKGEFIQFMDADDYLTGDKLSRSVEAFKSDPTLVCVYSDGCIEGDEHCIIEAAHSNIDSIVNKEFDEFTFGLNTNMPLFKRSFLMECGEKWDESLSCWQEADYYFRVLLKVGSRDYIHHLSSIGFVRTLNSGGVGSRQNTTRYVQHKLNAILKIRNICIQEGLYNANIANQVDRFLWLLYKHCTMCKLDELLGYIADNQANKTKVQQLVYFLPSSLVRALAKVVRVVKTNS